MINKYEIENVEFQVSLLVHVLLTCPAREKAQTQTWNVRRRNSARFNEKKGVHSSGVRLTERVHRYEVKVHYLSAKIH